MAHASILHLSHYLRRLTVRYGDAATDHELLQRFLGNREEDAFAALIERHATMVLRLCRSILRNHHDAEDIFQAVFLVLARKAGSIRKGDSVGSWLYSVSYRLAHKARARAGKRGVCEQKAAMPLEQTPMDEVTWGELHDILHEEVSRLPEKYRAAIVLCYWQGRTHEQAGQQLGCAKSTIKDRLERAREMLRSRLARRGLALPAAWFAASLSQNASAAVSLELTQTTVRGALLFSLGKMPQGIVSSNAIACAKGALQTMLMSKIKYVLALVLMLGVLGAGMGLAALRETTTPENEPEASATAAAPKHEPEALATEEPLPAGAVARLGTLRFRHSYSINHISISTDGTSILSAAGHIIYVWDLATGKERRRFLHKTPQFVKTPVTSFACSRDGKLLASGCHDGTIHLWDTETGQELRRYTAHKGRARDGIGSDLAYVIGFTPNNRQIVSMGSEGSYRVWDTESAEKVHEFGGFSNLSIGSLSPDGKTLAGVVKNDKTWELRLWEVASGRELKRISQPDKQILSPAFSPDGKLLAFAVGDENWQKPCDIQIWDAMAEKKIRTLQGHKGWANCTFAPDNKTLVTVATLGRDGPARLWDVHTGKEIGRIGDNQSLFNQLLFCPDGRTLASFTQGHHNLRFWDRANGKELRASDDPVTPIDFLSFSPDGRTLATGSTGHWVVRLWDVAARKTIRSLENGLLSAVQFSSDGRRLATAAWTDSQVRLWETANGKELRRIPSNEIAKHIHLMAWSGDGKALATWTWGQKERLVRLWDADTGKQLRELNAGMDRVASVIFSPDSKIVAALGSEMQSAGLTHILLWETDTGRLLRSLEMPVRLPMPVSPVFDVASKAPARLAFSPDGRTLAAGGQRAEASIYVWEMASGRIRFTLKQDEDVACLAFSPDGKLLAAANNHNAYRNYSPGPENLGLKLPLPYVHLWDLAAGKEMQVLKGHQGPISTLAFSPDGKRLATGSYDTTVLLWDATRFKTERPAEVQLRPEQLESLWADLGGENADTAYRAIRTLAAAPKTSVAFLKRHLKPVAPVDAKEVAGLLADLDSEQFAVREKAMQQLEKLGNRVATELRKALDGKPTLEVKRRIEQLLEKQNASETIRIVRALETLEHIGTAEARVLCATLADGVPDASLTREARATLRRMTR